MLMGCDSQRSRDTTQLEQLPVLGLGVSAVSSEPVAVGALHGARSTNSRGLEAYLSAIEAGEAASVEREVLTPAIARGEAVFLALRRVRDGLSAADFEAEFGAPPRRFFNAQIDELRQRGWIAEGVRGDLCLTPSGRLVSDTVFALFV